jgi:Protein of unknown function (DUF3383)
MTDWLPTLSIMEAFAAWNNSQPEKYVYAAYDSNAAPEGGSSPTCFAQVVDSENGTVPIWNPSGLIAAWLMGTIASINFNATNGRINFAYKGQAGLVPDVTTATAAANLLANGYNFYGAYATATQQFQFFQNGQISGSWDWIDPYVNQIYWNAAFQLALLELISQVGFIPYNSFGYTMIRTALGSVIAQMGNFGAWQAGVVLSGSQISAVNASAGLQIATTLQNQGWYLLVSDPGPTVRGNRGTPIISFYYTDGSSVNQITMASIDVE